jgi:hypothetical protein
VVREAVEFRAELVVVMTTELETPVPVGPTGKALVVPFP